ncbi:MULTISPECIES: Flp family type IVb pilin [Arthrobacter]|uniref:Flp family type IVb pilin n=1 Tax=Arthrobacter TaxID=1663 RepID=UPI00273A8AC6|nr:MULTISPECIES: Flp family type IVb pilin [Arthrobacter]MDV8146726.1 Flp family type IVb pilin [Arthrobacter sp. B10-11]WLQ06851.1 Flp family type IVb pilin [Arthrobacter oryzae]
MNSALVSMVAFIAGVKTRLTREEKGATMVEYGLMVALIAVVVIAALLILGPAIANLFTGVAGNL